MRKQVKVTDLHPGDRVIVSGVERVILNTTKHGTLVTLTLYGRDSVKYFMNERVYRVEK